MQIDQRIVATNRKQADLPGFFGQLTQTLGKQGMILAQEAANHEHRIEILDLR